MGIKKQSGFTIIEVTLFVAISGLLAISLLVGWSVTIASQRYKDSVDTTYSFLQQQYNLVFNVENARAKNFECTNGVPEQVTTANGGTPRGQTDCVLLGRYIQLRDGRVFTSRPVIGVEPSDELEGEDAAAVFAAYQPQVANDIDLSSDGLDVPWQAIIKGTKGPGGEVGDSERKLDKTIVILRSPQNGIVHTYIVDGSGTIPIAIPAEGTENGLLAADNEANDTIFCFDAGAVIQGNRQAIKIKKYAASQNAVVHLGDYEEC